MNYGTLISTAEFADQLASQNFIVFDCRHDLTNPEAGQSAYRESHIPGAQFVHLDRDLSGLTTGKNGRHPLPSPQSFAASLGKLGVDHSKQVIAYDAVGGIYASRLWWMLRWLGHNSVCVLDGGWQKWLAENRPVSKELPNIPAAIFTGSPLDLIVDTGYLETNFSQPRSKIIDARSPERYHGIGETLDRVGGHIPGALNRFFKDNLDANGCFKPPQELKRDFSHLIGTTPPVNVIHQCGSGIAACHNLLAMEIVGMCGAKLYPGSWSEWCSDSRRPIEI